MPERLNADPGQHDLAEGGEPALQRPEPLLLQPELVQFVFKGAAGVELLPQRAEEAACSSLGGRFAAREDLGCKRFERERAIPRSLTDGLEGPNLLEAPAEQQVSWVRRRGET